MTTHGGFEPVFCTIVPPHVLDRLARTRTPRSPIPPADPGARRRPAHPPPADHRHRRPGPPTAPAVSDKPQRTIYDARHKQDLPGKKVRAEGSEPGQGRHRQPRLRRARRHLRAVPEGLRPQLDRRRRPAARRDRPLRREVRQRLLGRRADGVRRRRRRAVPRLHHPGRRHRPRADPRRHQYTANLEYRGQSGALNESISDVFGSLVKQYALGQTAAEADWLIGAGLLAPERQRRRPALDEGPGHRVRRRRPRQGPAARDDGRLRQDRQRQRRRAHQLRHPQPRLLPGRRPRSAGTPGSGPGRSGTTS